MQNKRYKWQHLGLILLVLLNAPVPLAFAVPTTLQDEYAAIVDTQAVPPVVQVTAESADHTLKADSTCPCDSECSDSCAHCFPGLFPLNLLTSSPTGFNQPRAINGIKEFSSPGYLRPPRTL